MDQEVSAASQFDPDAFMAQQQGFDPDKFMAGQEKPAASPDYARAGGPVPGRPPAVGLLPGLTEGSANPFPEQGIVPTVQQYGRNIWNAVKGTAGTLGAAGRVAFPETFGPNPEDVNRLKQGVTAQAEQFKTAKRAAQGTGEFEGMSPGGRASEVVGHGAAGVLPGLGPAAAGAGEKFQRGDISGGIADTAALGTMVAAPEVIGKGAGAAAAKVRQFTTPNPDITLYQAVPFRHEMPDYYDMAPIVRADIKRAAQRSQGAPPSTTGVGGGWQPNTPATPAQLTGSAPLNDIPSVLKATQAAKAENRGVMDLHVDPYRQAGWRGQGDPIADEIVNAIPATLRARAQAGLPGAVEEVQRIVQEAGVYRRPFTPDEIFGLSKEFNAGLNNHFLKTADQQHALIGKGGDTASLEAAARGTRNLIRQSFGDDVSQLQRQWGWLDDVESGLRDQWKKVTKSPEETPPSDLDAAMLKAGIPGKVTHGNIAGAKFAWRGGKTNSLLQDTFDNTEPGWPLPTPQPSGMPGLGGMPRAAPPNRQLPPATPQIGRNYVPATGMQTPPGGPMTGGMPPGPQQNVWQGIGAPRQLPAGSPTQGQGVIQVPPPGAANRAGSTGTLNQIPPSPRTAAAPADTSGISYYGPNPLVGSTAREPIVQQMGKAVWEATKPKAEEAPAPAAAPPPVVAPTQVSTPGEVNAALERALSDEGLPKAAPAQKATPVRARRAAPGTSSGTLDKALQALNEGMAKTRQAPPGTPAPQATPPAAAPKAAPKQGGLDYPNGWTPGPADRFFDFQKSRKAGEEPYVSWKEDAPLPPALSEAQIGEAQRFIDGANARTPGGFQGIQDRLENVKYYQAGAGSRFPTSAGDRADAIKELLHSVNPMIAKRILEAGL